MWAIGIHGGAGSLSASSIEADRMVLDQAIAWASGELAQGRSALDVVEGAIRILEDSAQFVAGKGSLPNIAGEWELDASICDGKSRKAGAVAALNGAYPPISIARAVMERTEHVMLVGGGAFAFARECGFAEIPNPSAFFSPRGRGAPAPGHGTVGAVALDSSGAIAAGTSTGGTTNKRRGRVGDSPIIGAGTWADDKIGVSCTGAGEFFMRASAAHSAAFHLRHLNLALDAAIAAALGEVAQIGGKGGLIAVDKDGSVEFSFNSDAMRIGVANSSGHRDIRVAVKQGD